MADLPSRNIGSNSGGLPVSSQSGFSSAGNSFDIGDLIFQFGVAYGVRKSFGSDVGSAIDSSLSTFVRRIWNIIKEKWRNATWQKKLVIIGAIFAAVAVIVYKSLSTDDSPDPLLPDWVRDLPGQAANAFVIGAGVALTGFGVSLSGTQNIQQAPISESNMAALVSTLRGGVNFPPGRTPGAVPDGLIGSMFYMPSSDGGATSDKVVYVTNSPSGSGYNINVVSVGKDGSVTGPLPPNYPRIPLFQKGSGGNVIPNPAGQAAIDKMFSFGTAAASPNLPPTVQNQMTVKGSAASHTGIQ